MEERADRRQTNVPALRGVVPLLLQVFEEASEERSVQICDAQGGGDLLQMSLGKSKDQAKRVAIIRDGVRAGVALIHESFREKCLKQFGEVGLGFHCPASFRWHRRVARLNNSGTAER